MALLQGSLSTMLKSIGDVYMVEFIDILISFFTVVGTYLGILGVRKGSDGYLKLACAVGFIGLILIYFSCPWIQL